MMCPGHFGCISGLLSGLDCDNDHHHHNKIAQLGFVEFVESLDKDASRTLFRNGYDDYHHHIVV